jgi:hypothetical protein
MGLWQYLADRLSIRQQWLFSCRYLSSLPLVLVVGVATTLAAFHRLLPQSITAKLTINT